MAKAQKQYFTKQLIDWHHTENQRSLPWKNEKDPYKIWLSEIILQQTRAEQGLPYYNAFINAYPTVRHLANAKDEEVFRLWQGLGYYNRCKNLLFTARYITEQLNGKFPDTFDDLIKLKGIGTYTAAAIASFAYGLPHAVVDGNVYRVLSRYLGIDTPCDTTEGRKLYAQFAGELLEKKDSAAFNQAIMDFGATICTPQNYDCINCPLQKKCIAFQQEMVGLLPVKSKKLIVKHRYFHYVLFIYNEKVWIKKRTEKDIWQNLHELFLIEHHTILDTEALAAHLTNENLAINSSELVFDCKYTQKLTHQLINTVFYSYRIANPTLLKKYHGTWVKIGALKFLGFPKTIVSFLEKKLYF